MDNYIFINDKKVCIEPDTTIKELEKKYPKTKFFIGKGIIPITSNDRVIDTYFDNESLLDKMFCNSKQLMIKDYNELTIDKINISFHKTLRVPFTGTYNLPPSFGKFDIGKQNGRYYIKMFQCEAMFIDISTPLNYAVKIGIGNINAITGEKWKKGLSLDPQNFVYTPKQLWLDGVYSKKGYIRQFVAVPLEAKASIENQLIKEGKKGDCLRIEIHKPKDIVIDMSMYKQMHVYNSEMEIFNETERHSDFAKIVIKDGNLTSGRSLEKKSTISKFSTSEKTIIRGYNTNYSGTMLISIKRFGGECITLEVKSSMKVRLLKLLIEMKIGIPIDQQILIFNGKSLLENNRALYTYNIVKDSVINLILRLRGGMMPEERMTLSAGGLIKQQIYKYQGDLDNFTKIAGCKINILHPIERETTPIGYDMYRELGYPWFDYYTQDETVDHISIMEKLTSYELVEADECYICLYNKVNMKFDCRHTMCSDCFNRLATKTCPICRSMLVNKKIVTGL